MYIYFLRGFSKIFKDKTKKNQQINLKSSEKWGRVEKNLDKLRLFNGKKVILEKKFCVSDFIPFTGIS